LDAIFNYTFLPHIWNVYTSFFQSPMGPKHGSRVKIRGHVIAHRTPLSPRTNALYGTSENGWMDTNLFNSWFKQGFLKWTARLPRPLLLVYDGHMSHI